MSGSNPFGGISEASTPNRQGQFFKYNDDLTTARYRGKVNKTRLQDTRKGLFFIAEIDVIDTDVHRLDGSPLYRRGETLTCMIPISGDEEKVERGMKNVKGCLLACVNSAADAKGAKRPGASVITAEFSMKCCEDNLLSGAVVNIEASHIKTKRGSDFTVVLFLAPKDTDDANWVAGAVVEAAPEHPPASAEGSEDLASLFG
mgnify:CR=1 FL=1|tara:strand:- start:2594 stop:3199 length:606 start_codon:yes stop_codon:yes gene_type:complete